MCCWLVSSSLLGDAAYRIFCLILLLIGKKTVVKAFVGQKSLENQFLGFGLTEAVGSFVSPEI